ncbi:MFS transporter [Burkholderia multivorans]|nr:MFS transporter [Burkholderia multivorans]
MISLRRFSAHVRARARTTRFGAINCGFEQRRRLPTHSHLPGAAHVRTTPALLYRRIALRVIPFLFLCYVVNFVDRVNIGFAKLQFLQDPGLNEAVFGCATAIFFISCAAFEVPSNLMLERIGATRTLMRIMVLWGLCTVAQMFVAGSVSLYVVRFLLRTAEAAFFPDLILYLSYWFPPCGARPCQQRAAVRRSGGSDDRRGAVWLDHGAHAGHDGVARMAVAIPDRGLAGHRARPRCAADTERPAGTGGMAVGAEAASAPARSVGRWTRRPPTMRTPISVGNAFLPGAAYAGPPRTPGRGVGHA